MRRRPHLPQRPGSPSNSPTAVGSSAAPAAEWVQRSDVAGGPSARQDHTWTVDEANEVAYLFGGLTADGASNELWAFDLVGQTWTHVQPATDGTGARFGHTATWSLAFGLVVWSGQGKSAFFDDIWAYDPRIKLVDAAAIGRRGS